MKTDRIFVLLLVVMLPMSGCFDDGVGDAEAADDTDEGTTVINNYYYNNTSQSNTQQLTYFSSGGIEYSSWNEDGVNGFGYLESNHSNYSGANSMFTQADEYDTSECISKGGVVDGVQGYMIGIMLSGTRPLCTINLASINTSAGQALVIHEMSNAVIKTVCNGVEVTPTSDYFANGRVSPGSALDCIHQITYSMTYSTSEEMIVWSIMYSIQPTVVV
jgi:hypothetical protein